MKRNLLIGIISLFLGLSGLAQAGTITGTVKYEGAVPNFKPIKMDADPVCAMHHAEGGIMPEVLVLGEGQTMANIFVKVKSGLTSKEYPAPTEKLVLDQKGCMYTPHVFGIRVGQPLEILNPDGTLHNVHAMSKVNAEFNMAMPKFRKTAMKKWDKAEEMFPIKCDVHPWMKTWVSVMDHPYFDVTQTDGVFTIEGLEPGTYEIEAWHEKLGAQVATVTISADETVTADFTFKKPS